MRNVLFGNFNGNIWYPGDGAVEPELVVMPEEEPLDELEPIWMDDVLEPDDDFNI